MKLPNWSKAELHERISYAKSAIRLVGYATLPFSITVAACVLFFSELLGVAEEVWGA